jgi:hypothetical protein
VFGQAITVGATPTHSIPKREGDNMRKAIIVLGVALLFSGCTKAERESYTRRIAAENGRINRHVVVGNSRTGEILWEGEGKINLENSSNGGYTLLIFAPEGSRRVLVNGRDNWIVVEDME